MLSLKVTTAGASSSLTLTREDMTQLKVSHGDTICLTRAPDGGYRLTHSDPDFTRQMALAEQVMQEDREVLQELAK